MRRREWAPVVHCGIEDHRTGFTLMELLVVVIVLGILAGIALPNLRKTTELGYKREATDTLLTIYSAERAYFAHHQAYQDALVPCGPPPPDPCWGDWRAIGMDDPNNAQVSPVQFSVVADNNPPAAFTATADRGNNKTLTIDENRVLTDKWSIP